MRKIVKLLVPAFIAVAFFASCEDQMDEITVRDGANVEETVGVLPDKNLIKTPPEDKN